MTTVTTVLNCVLRRAHRFVRSYSGDQRPVVPQQHIDLGDQSPVGPQQHIDLGNQSPVGPQQHIDLGNQSPVGPQQHTNNQGSEDGPLRLESDGFSTTTLSRILVPSVSTSGDSKDPYRTDIKDPFEERKNILVQMSSAFQIGRTEVNPF